MRKLDGINVIPAAAPEVFAANIAASNLREMLDIHDLPEWREHMPIALVGGGPSLVDHLDELKRYELIMVCGSAHDFVVSQGVKPQWAVCCDPDPVAAVYYTNPVKSCTYLIASACDPAVFDALDGYSVARWHSGGSDFSPEIWGDGRKVIIGGGCTVGSRALMIAICFGFSNIHFFGFDGCVQGDRHHAYNFANDDPFDIGSLVEVHLGSPEAPAYRMAGYMLGQFFDFDRIIGKFGSRLTLTVHGEGPLNDLVKYGEAKRNGEEN